MVDPNMSASREKSKSAIQARREFSLLASSWVQAAMGGHGGQNFGPTMVRGSPKNRVPIRRANPFSFFQKFRHIFGEDVPGLNLRNTFLSTSDFDDF